MHLRVALNGPALTMVIDTEYCVQYLVLSPNMMRIVMSERLCKSYEYLTKRITDQRIDGASYRKEKKQAKMLRQAFEARA